MSRWFRAYDDSLDDPKVQTLPGELFKAWYNLLCVSSKNGGRPFNVEEIAFRLRIKAAKAQTVADEFIKRGLLDVSGDGFILHNWNGRQYQSDVSTERVKQFRERKRNVSVTPPDTEQNTEAETERKKEYARAVALVSDWPLDFREKFWDAYPRKVGKLGALRVLERVRWVSVPWETLISAVRAYSATANPQYTKHPKTWLTNGCWDDKPDTRQGNGKTSVLTAADELVERVRRFNDPAPRDDDLRLGTGAPPVRAISQG